jgi:uncharacterized protein YcfL
MKKIQNLNLWVNGQNKTANTFFLRLINDNLKDSATFNYQLFYEYTDANGYNQQELLVDNTLTIDGQDYIDWGLSSDINTDAFTICANKLNLTIL